MQTNMISFDNGFEFYKDLLATYGKEQALFIANSYLDCQAHTKDSTKDKTEYQFCCELYQATQLYK